jgi:uncharacterized membrane protein YqjE
MAIVTGEPPQEEPGPIGGLVKSVANLFASLLALAQTRLELLTTELQAEMHRVAEILVWTLIALLSAGMGLFLAALAIVFVFWDTHRIAAAVGVTVAFFTLAVVAVLVLRAKVRGRPRLLEATLAELNRDREQLRSRR